MVSEMVSTVKGGWGSSSNIRKELERTKKELEDARLKMERYRATLRLAGVNIERRNRVIRALTSFPYQASRMTEPAALLKLGLSQALEMTEAKVGAIVIIDPATKELSLGAHEGLTPDLVRILTGKQFDAGAATLMPHLVAGTGALVEESENADEGERMLLASAQVSSLMSLPLFAGEQLLGTLVAGTVDESRFSPASTHFLIAIAQGIAIALESLRLRERLWHMAEMFLSQAMTGEGTADTLDTPPPLLPPLQAKLADLVASLGGTIGAIFFLDTLKEDLQITLAADYGLSPIFTSEYAQFRNSYAYFPFHQLLTHNLLVKNLAQVNARQPLPLLKSLQEEGARSLVAAYFSDPDEGKMRVILVACNKVGAFTAVQFDPLITMSQSLLPLLDEPPSVPTLPTRSVHVPSMTLEAKEGDLELLLAAMMEAEEEVQRHNADFVTLNDISEMLVQTLELGPVLAEVLGRIKQMLQTEAAWLYLMEDSDNERAGLRLAAYEALSEEFVTAVRHLPILDTLEGEVALENKARHLNDVSQAMTQCQVMHEMEQVQAVAAVPLSCPEVMIDGRAHRRVVGVLVVAMRQSHTWQPRQIRLLNTVANQMGFAINNALLYAQVKEDMEAYSVSNQFLKQVNDALMGI
jgi:GAF domain-containing protein